jgi:DNA-binding GntR family transcriptional regulator
MSSTSVSSERAYHHIKAAILQGRYRSGMRLPEDMIAAELGVSRTPIRDALRRLQVEQLVFFTPYSGARVASWSPREIEDTAQIRAMLESFAARLAAERRTADHLASLRALCARLEAEAARPATDMELVTADNIAFHRTVAQASGNGRIVQLLEPLWSVPMLPRPPSASRPDSLTLANVHHREIVLALEEGDPDWAEAAMRTHVIASRIAYLGFSEIDGAGLEPAADGFAGADGGRAASRDG